jgi:serine/threonine protein kinase
LVLEYAELGSLFHLQTSASRLPWRIKQKLCYDVGRGLSLLHACDIVHGDLKHENVLIFKNKYTTVEGQPYTASWRTLVDQ